MLIKKVIDVSAPLTAEQEAELEALEELDDDDIFMDEDCPPMIDEELDWLGYLINKYNTRSITKEIIDLEKSQMTEEQFAAYDYMRAKKAYIIEILKEQGGMKYGELKKYLKEHPFEAANKSA